MCVCVEMGGWNHLGGGSGWGKVEWVGGWRGDERVEWSGWEDGEEVRGWSREDGRME